MPKTYHPVLLRNKARKLRKDTGDERWQAPIEVMGRSITQTIIRSIYRPFLLLALEAMCLNLCLLSALLLGVLYLFFGAFNIVFMTSNSGKSAYPSRECWLGCWWGQRQTLGTCRLQKLDSRYRLIINPRLVSQQEAYSGEPGGPQPEYRLPPAIGGAILVPVGLLDLV